MSSARVYNNLPLPLPNILEGVTLIPRKVADMCILLHH